MASPVVTVQSTTSSKLTSYLEQLENFKSKSLWHQLTLKLLETVQDDEFKGEETAMNLYNTYIKDMEAKLNLLQLMEIVYYLIQQLETPKALELLQTVEKKLLKNEEALALCKVLQGALLLEKMGDAKKAKELLDEVEVLLDNTRFTVSSKIHGRYYKLASKWYMTHSDHVNYYSAALKYLGCVDVDSLVLGEQQDIAIALIVAALLGEKLYNLGELMYHPIMSVLKTKTAPRAWVFELLKAVNNGDLSVVGILKSYWSQIPDLEAKHHIIEEKTKLLCIVQMCVPHFNLPLADISKKTFTPLPEVELLLMRAMAHELLRGRINQSDGFVHVTWVRPRALDNKELKVMISQLDDWCSNIKEAENHLAQNAKDIIEL
uniref:26S proteasome non-ATPase regulatory subunit 13 n=2 Tax=Timema TaxID=61471 RepID=A0A7R9ID55_9NEOP|nr:unnamed protein product [Timema bartmani]CAD7454905.1 unnamed protein product [Timema tahoe]